MLTYSGSVSSSVITIPIEYLVVAGGGGGQTTGSGGGAGGMRTGSFTILGSMTVTVGTGGSGGSQNFATNPSNGTDSVFSIITSLGGGCGVTHGGSTGAAGGSGGGASCPPYTGSAVAIGGAGTAGQGNRGGNAAGADTWFTFSAGGGGAGGPGTDVTSSAVDGNGGPGLASSITGASVMYAAGGAGGEIASQRNATGGSGIGGNSQWEDIGTAGAANTGSGGGGGSFGGSTGRVSGEAGGPYWRGGSGGSGVVVIAYPNTYPAPVSISGLTFNQPTRSGFRVYRFTAGTGTINFQ